ncbi:hypothetical protein J6590_019880 [Homalodisca vitripennis]|nr:hypothetical protein J6590_019880 [Homalodisca vitripennis]
MELSMSSDTLSNFVWSCGKNAIKTCFKRPLRRNAFRDLNPRYILELTPCEVLLPPTEERVEEEALGVEAHQSISSRVPSRRIYAGVMMKGEKKYSDVPLTELHSRSIISQPPSMYLTLYAYNYLFSPTRRLCGRPVPTLEYKWGCSTLTEEVEVNSSLPTYTIYCTRRPISTYTTPTLYPRSPIPTRPDDPGSLPRQDDLANDGHPLFFRNTIFLRFNVSKMLIKIENELFKEGK